MYFQAAGCDGTRSHCIFSMGRLSWNDFTAAFTPDSAFICSDIFPAAATASEVRQNRIASARLLEVSCFCGMGNGPAPAAATMFPQNG